MRGTGRCCFLGGCAPNNNSCALAHIYCPRGATRARERANTAARACFAPPAATQSPARGASRLSHISNFLPPVLCLAPFLTNTLTTKSSLTTNNNLITNQIILQIQVARAHPRDPVVRDGVYKPVHAERAPSGARGGAAGGRAAVRRPHGQGQEGFLGAQGVGRQGAGVARVCVCVWQGRFVCFFCWPRRSRVGVITLASLLFLTCTHTTRNTQHLKKQHNT